LSAAGRLCSRALLSGAPRFLPVRGGSNVFLNSRRQSVAFRVRAPCGKAAHRRLLRVKTIRCRLLAFALLGLSLGSAQAEPNWLTDFRKAREEAKSSHKLLLLDFTGSDWCGWCIRLQREVFSKPEFEEYARDNLVLMKVDFPRAQALTAEVRSQNQALAQKYGIQGFPTIVVLNESGKPVGALGYMPGGPSAFIGELKKLPKS
jgi:thioredoxin-related protein